MVGGGQGAVCAVCYWRHEFIDEDINTNGAIEVETNDRPKTPETQKSASASDQSPRRRNTLNAHKYPCACSCNCSGQAQRWGVLGAGILGENNHRFTWNHFAPQNAKEMQATPKGKSKERSEVLAGYARICLAEQPESSPNDINSNFCPIQDKQIKSDNFANRLNDFSHWFVAGPTQMQNATTF